MSTAERTEPATQRPSATLRGRWRPTPLSVLAAGLALLAVGAGLVAAHVTVWALDETVLEQSAVHYSTNFPYSLLHDLNARATDRLYSLVLSVAFRIFNGPQAIRFDHVLSVVLFVSAAFPIYLLARRFLRSPWAAVAVALLSVAFPWLTLTTALFTENLSYPLFWWAMGAACHALWRPGVRRDALTLLAIALLVVTRVQFVSVFVGYVVAAAVITCLRWRLSPTPRRAAPVLRAAIRAYVLSAAVVVAAIAFVIYLRASGQYGAEVQGALGTYSNVVIRNGLPPNMVEGLLVELMALGLGVGLIPAIVSLTWYSKRLVAPRLDEKYVYLAGGGVILAVFLALTVFSQFGYLGPITEERYFFYVVPVFWLGTFAAFAEPNVVRPGELVACGLAFAAIFGAIPFLSPLTAETAFLAPSQSVVQHVMANRLGQLGLGLTVQDALAALVFLSAVVCAFLWTRRPRIRIGWTVGLAAALQLVITGYAYAVITGHVEGITGRTGGDLSALGWVDSNTRTGHVAWLDNISVSAPPAITEQDQQRTTLFYNKHLTSWLALPELGLPIPIFPMSALPGSASLQVDPRSGVLQPQDAVADVREVVGEVASPFLQLQGRTVAHAPGGGMTLTELSAPVRASWLASGLQPDGSVAAGTPAKLYAFTSPSNPATRIRLTLQFASVGSGSSPGPAHATVLKLRFGSTTRSVSLVVGSTRFRVLTLTACARSSHPVVSGTLAATRSVAVAGGRFGGVLEHVIATSTPVVRCPP